MRVKYKETNIILNTNVAGGTGAQWASFLSELVDFLILNGAPLENVEVMGYEESTTEMGTAGILMTFSGESANEEDEPACLEFFIEMDNNRVYLAILGYGRKGDAIYNRIDLGATTRKYFSFPVHAIKSENSFYFGFRNYESNKNGFINCAITPMRRLSNPNENVGYALVMGVAYNEISDYLNIGMACRTMPYIEGYNYAPYDEPIIYTVIPEIFLYPEVETGKIPLMPFFTGCEDIYYENVYLTPMRNNGVEEKAFETDKGVFLISNMDMYHDDTIEVVNWTEMPYCQLAFDITGSLSEI